MGKMLSELQQLCTSALQYDESPKAVLPKLQRTSWVIGTAPSILKILLSNFQPQHSNSDPSQSPEVYTLVEVSRWPDAAAGVVFNSRKKKYDVKRKFWFYYPLWLNCKQGFWGYSNIKPTLYVTKIMTSMNSKAGVGKRSMCVRECYWQGGGDQEPKPKIEKLKKQYKHTSRSTELSSRRNSLNPFKWLILGDKYWGCGN